MENSYYVIHDFMVKALKLSGVSLLVYALIYSFTKVGGECYGSMEYIAERVGSSRTSVYRALKELIRKNLIVKHKSEKYGKISYVANVEFEFQDATQEISEFNTASYKMTPNNKEDNKEEIITNNHSFIQKGAKPEIMRLGKDKVIVLTRHQYDNLVRSLGYMPFFHYLDVLEERILAKPMGSYKNHYKTIITWAREDGLVDEDGEMILAN